MKQPDLFIKQFVDEGLGNSSYLIGSTETGRAAVIDPQRDVDRYLQVAEGMGLRLAYAFDTHLHADFVSGARELFTRVTEPFRIGASAKAALDFDHMPLHEGDTFSLGDISIGVLAPPSPPPGTHQFHRDAGRICRAPFDLYRGCVDRRRRGPYRSAWSRFQRAAGAAALSHAARQAAALSG